MITKQKLIRYARKQYAGIPLSTAAAGTTGLKAVISLKIAGDMGFNLRDKLPYRRMFYQSLRINPNHVFTVNQEHTQRVILVQKENVPADFYPEIADGLVSAGTAHLIGVTVADCLPLLITSNDGGACGIVHSGWKGTGIVLRALTVFKEKLGYDPSSLSVCLGPAIGPCCYAVDESRAERFAAQFGENTVSRRGGRYFIDLYRANINLVTEWGIQRITLVDECTSCTTDLGSFRRQGAAGFTRMLVLLGRIHPET